jgi:phage host-nuclease inhibitor protein Gam
MLRMAMGGVCVALVVVGLAAADSRPGVTALRNQVKALKKEEEVTIKAVQARYKAIKRRDRLTERELKFERAEIKKQEDVALALAGSATEQAEIRKNYDALRAYLTRGAKFEEREIRMLDGQERAQIHQIKALYAARIKQLEHEIHTLERANTGKKR